MYQSTILYYVVLNKIKISYLQKRQYCPKIEIFYHNFHILCYIDHVDNLCKFIFFFKNRKLHN